MRFVLDTATMVAAIRSDAGASRQLLPAALDRRFACLASVALLIEYEAVMTRAEHLAVSGLSVDDVGIILDALAAVVEPLTLAFSRRPKVRDPNDDMVLEAAINGRADAIATFNLKDLREGAAEFGILVLSPFEALRMLELQA